jgi:hypothetical protein
VPLALPLFVENPVIGKRDGERRELACTSPPEMIESSAVGRAARSWHEIHWRSQWHHEHATLNEPIPPALAGKMAVCWAWFAARIMDIEANDS